MRRGKPAFMIIEFMIAFALSSVVMLGITQASHSVARLLQSAKDLMMVNRKAALFFNQIERDVTAAVSYQKPIAYAPAKKKDQKQGDEKQGDEKQPQAPEKKDADAGKKEKYIPTFSLEPFEDAAYKYRQKKWQLTKKFSLITTSPLFVYDEVIEHWVRVGYELVQDKQSSVAEKPSYTLYRMQTSVVENYLFKEEENDKKIAVSRCAVASGVHKFSIEAQYEKRPSEKKEGASEVQNQENEPVNTFSWKEEEEKKKSKYTLPQSLSLYIEMWDDRQERTYSFECILPFFVQVAAQEKKEEPKKEEAAQKSAETLPVPSEEVPHEQ